MVDVEEKVGVVETPEDNQEKPSGEDTGIDEKPAEEAGEKAEEPGKDEPGEPGEKDSGDEGEDSAKASEGKEQPSGKEEMFQVGDRNYSKSELIDVASKVNRFQGDRDRSEQALTNFVRQVRAAGLDVDPQSMQIIQPAAKTNEPSDQELAEAAASGDVTALNALRERDRQKTINAVMSQNHQLTQQTKVLDHVKTHYSDIYVKDEKGNIIKDSNGVDVINFDSPLTKEVEGVLKQFPALKQQESMAIVSEIAQGRLNQKNMGKIEKGIRKNAQTRFSKSAGNVAAGSSAGVQEAEIGLSDGQKMVTKAFNQDPARIGKIIQRARENNGRYIVE